MRRMEMITAVGVTLAALGAIGALAISSGDGARTLAAHRTPPVEVRTEVIRKTVNVYRREHPHHVGGTGPGGASPGHWTAGSSGPVSTSTRTRSSGARSAAPVSPVVTTRSSGSRSGSGPARSRPQPLTTRTSGSAGHSGSSHAVTTRSSAGGERDGGRDD
ncbi:MAG: hypothetical protein ACYDHT_07595 [Solirubrobacteraceae bacterium]